MPTNENVLIGALIGFAPTPYVTSTLFITLFSGSNFATNFDKESLITTR